MGGRSVTLITMATMLEAKPFVVGLGLKPYDKKPFPVFTTENLVLVISGIGKAHAAAATAYGLLTFSPSAVLNTGAAGALDRSHPTGSIYQINNIIEHDRPNILTGKPVRHKPDKMKGFDDAVLASGDRPVIDREDRSRLAALADLVDMEAAAVVQTCRTMSVPCHIFKFVSDDPGHTVGTHIIHNIRKFRVDLFDFCSVGVLPRLS